MCRNYSVLLCRTECLQRVMMVVVPISRPKFINSNKIVFPITASPWNSETSSHSLLHHKRLTSDVATISSKGKSLVKIMQIAAQQFKLFFPCFSPIHTKQRWAKSKKGFLELDQQLFYVSCWSRKKMNNNFAKVLIYQIEWASERLKATITPRLSIFSFLFSFFAW